MDIDGSLLADALRKTHGCPRDCPHCDAGTFVPDDVRRWEVFVASSGALRAARHCKRSGAPFPTLSGDEVVQYLIEEAVFERLALVEARARTDDTPGEEMVLDDPMRHARDFAAGRV